jgi:serine/threonine-protein kinase
MAKIGRYEILEELGRGAMGVVFKARDPQIGRIVAIKVILTANLTTEDLQHYKARFMREAQAAGQMSHPGIVTIHDIAEDELGQPYLVMEFIEGQTLEKMLTPPSAPPGEKTDSGLNLPTPAPRLLISHSLDIGAQVADALDYAHRRGVIHRDIKPANIIIASDGRAKIADFGIAKTADSGMTQTNMRMGTPAFMSPEQVSGTPVDSRSDIFSLGSVLYWMFTGERPFPGESVTTIVYKVVFSQPLPASYINRALPTDVDLVLGRCLAKNANDRYVSAKEVADDLRNIKEGRPVRATPAPAADMTAILDDKSPAANIVAGLPIDQKAAALVAAPGAQETVKIGSAPAPSPKPAEADAEATADIPVLTVDAKPARDRTAQAVPKPEPKPRPFAPALEPTPSASPIATAEPVPVAGAAPEQSKEAKRSSLKPILAGVGIVVVLAVTYLMWSGRTKPPDSQQQAAPSTAPAGVATAPGAGEPAKIAPAPTGTTPGKVPSSGTSAVKTSPATKTPASPTPPEAKISITPKSPAVFPKGVPKSTLMLDVRHNFKSAAISVMLGNTLVHQGILLEKEKKVVVPIEIPAGERVVRVRVQSETPKFDQEREVGGTFAAGMARPLVVEFGRGSGAGFTERRLTLRLGDPTAIPAKKP